MGGNHEAFQSNHSSHPSLIKFSAVSTDLRRKKDTACLVCRHLESFKQVGRWSQMYFICQNFSPDLKMKNVMQTLTSENILEPLKTEKVRQNRTCKICFIFAENIYVKSGFYFWLTVHRWLHLQCWNAMICCNILKSRFRIFIVWVLKKLGNGDRKGKTPTRGKDGSCFYLSLNISNSESKRLIILIIIQRKLWNSISNKNCSCGFYSGSLGTSWAATGKEKTVLLRSTTTMQEFTFQALYININNKMLHSERDTLL